MAYRVYLDKMMLPVAPSKITLKIKNQNKTLHLINEGECSILKQAGLSEFDFEVLLPNVPYPFAVYENGFEKAKFFTDKLKALKLSKAPFSFKVERTFPNGKSVFDTDMTVSLEEYSVGEDVKSSFDLSVKISLKEFRAYGTKTCEVTLLDSTVRASVTVKREESASPAPKGSAKTHTVASGDSLWAISKYYYGDGARYPDIYAANQETIDGGNKGTGHEKHSIHPAQVLTIPVLGG